MSNNRTTAEEQRDAQQKIAERLSPEDRNIMATARATKAEVLARLDEAHVALIGAADAMARRYGSSDQAKQLCGAAAMITNDWVPAIYQEQDDA